LNTDFILMEDNAAAHDSRWTSAQRGGEEIPLIIHTNRLMRRQREDHFSRAMVAALREDVTRKFHHCMQRCLKVNEVIICSMLNFFYSL